MRILTGRAITSIGFSAAIFSTAAVVSVGSLAASRGSVATWGNVVRLQAVAHSAPELLIRSVQAVESAPRLYVLTDGRLGNKNEDASALDYVAPASAESLPRDIRVGGASYGHSIAIGSNYWVHDPSVQPFLFVEASLPGRPAARIRNELFYGLELAKRAVHFAKTSFGFDFSAASYSGRVWITRVFADRVTASLEEELAGRKVHVSLSYTFRRLRSVAPIVAPPRAVVATNGTPLPSRRSTSRSAAHNPHMMPPCSCPSHSPAYGAIDRAQWRKM